MGANRSGRKRACHRIECSGCSVQIGSGVGARSPAGVTTRCNPSGGVGVGIAMWRWKPLCGRVEALPCGGRCKDAAVRVSGRWCSTNVGGNGRGRQRSILTSRSDQPLEHGAERRRGSLPSSFSWNLLLLLSPLFVFVSILITNPFVNPSPSSFFSYTLYFFIPSFPVALFFFLFFFDILSYPAHLN